MYKQVFQVYCGSLHTTAIANTYLLHTYHKQLILSHYLSPKITIFLCLLVCIFHWAHLTCWWVCTCSFFKDWMYFLFLEFLVEIPVCCTDHLDAQTVLFAITSSFYRHRTGNLFKISSSFYRHPYHRSLLCKYTLNWYPDLFLWVSFSFF
jgi:hypothetical protein